MIHLLYHFELFQSYTLLSINKLIFKSSYGDQNRFLFLMVEYLGILHHVLS